MGNLLTFSYWFNTRPGNMQPKFLCAFLIFVAALLILTFILSILKKRQRGMYYKLMEKLYNFSLGNFVIGLFLAFFTYELIPLLSMRFLLLLWALGMIVWLGFIVRALLKIPKIKEEKLKEQEFKKYIP